MIESLSVSASVLMISKHASLREKVSDEGTVFYRVASPEINRVHVGNNGIKGSKVTPGWTTKQHENPEAAWDEAVTILVNQPTESN